MKANILVFDIGSTYTKAAAFHLSGSELTLLGRGQTATTLENIKTGAEQAEEVIKKQGVLFDDKIMRYSSCSAAGGLRMVALGYMPRVTAKAAKEVAMTAGARVMEVISAEEPPSYREEVLKEIRPDIILLAGGTDSGDETSVAENIEVICRAKCHATVILACNSHVQRYAADQLSKAHIPYIRVANIMPTIHELKVKPARKAIHEQFINQITRAGGLKEFRETLADKTVVPTPGAVLLASELLAKGTHEQEGAGGLILIDIGGATTDIHSALPELEDLELEERGLIVNNEKQFSYRTVEGNLGLRVSAAGIPEAVGEKAVLRAMDPPFDEMSEEDLLAYTELLEANTGHIPADRREEAADRGLASCAIDVALRRHAGFYAQESDPVMGIMAGTAMGRDLRAVNKVLCAGGIFAHSDPVHSRELAARCFRKPGISLLPLHDPQIILDHDYILYAMGVLGRQYPDAVLAFMKKNLLKETR